MSTLVPIIKDKLGNINSSKNYRSVAVSSILVKLIDWVIILLEGDVLKLNELQFAYQTGCSTVMCTWAAVETIDYYLNNGSEIFSCATDMSKAFDLTLHSLMFKKMLGIGMCPIYVRLLIFIYINQTANVRWNGELSELFSVRNGCGQGKVLAAIAYCIYVEDLFKLLKMRRSGCWILGVYCGIFGYSDDNWLLAPSLNALQDMIKTCEEYAASHNLRFSTDANPKKSKTKCMAFLKYQRDLPNMVLCGNSLPWVDSLVHLGTKVSNSSKGGKLDMKAKESSYIQKTCSINQEFSFAHPVTKIVLNRVYNCHFSGGQLWDLFGQDAQKFISTYNRSIKAMADLPIATHRYLLEPLTEQRHMFIQLIRNFISFVNKVKQSPKKILRVLYKVSSRDTRTVTGSNLRNILLLTSQYDVDGLAMKQVDQLKYREMDPLNQWRISLIWDIINIKNRVFDLPDSWTQEDLDQVLISACTE